MDSRDLHITDFIINSAWDLDGLKYILGNKLKSLAMTQRYIDPNSPHLIAIESLLLYTPLWLVETGDIIYVMVGIIFEN